MDPQQNRPNNQTRPESVGQACSFGSEGRAELSAESVAEMNEGVAAQKAVRLHSRDSCTNLLSASCRFYFESRRTPRSVREIATCSCEGQKTSALGPFVDESCPLRKGE